MALLTGYLDTDNGHAATAIGVVRWQCELEDTRISVNVKKHGCATTDVSWCTVPTNSALSRRPCRLNSNHDAWAA